MPDSPDPNRLRVVSLHDPAGVAERLERQPDAAEIRFNSIADLKRGVPAGYEAVFCIGEGSAALSPHGWSQQVHVHAAGQVEARLVEMAIAARDQLPENTFLAIDVSAQALLAPELP